MVMSFETPSVDFSLVTANELTFSDWFLLASFSLNTLIMNFNVYLLDVWWNVAISLSSFVLKNLLELMVCMFVQSFYSVCDS